MNSHQLLLAAVALAVVTVATAAAWAGDCSCPECGKKVCSAIPEEKTTTKDCYEVEHKEICIPRFRWPWEKCHEPKCGRVITVSVLKKVEYECHECGYRWEINCVGPGCGVFDRDHADVGGARRRAVQHLE